VDSVVVGTPGAVSNGTSPTSPKLGTSAPNARIPDALLVAVQIQNPIDHTATVGAREELEEMGKRPDTAPAEADRRGRPAL